MPQLISVADAIATGPVALPRKSAGLAWVLSLVVPGAGHVYAGLYLRAALLMGISLLGLIVIVVAAVSGGPQAEGAVGVGVIVLPILWIFGTLDSYLSVVERNRGIDPSTVDNPRIAALLNLVTRGFGYFYLGERTKGLVVFAGMSAARILTSGLSGRPAATVVELLLVGITIGIAIDAYRIGRRAFDAQVASMELPPAGPPSRVPPALPLIVAAATGLALLFIIGAGAVMSGDQPRP